jgi:hypothetical protein
MATKSSNPVLGPETIASLRRKSEQARKANEAARLRTGRSTPQQLKALAAKAKAAEKALKKAEREALQKKNREKDAAISRLNKNNYGSMDGSTSDRRSGTKQLTAAQLKAKAAQKRDQDLKKLIRLQDAADYRERRKKEDQLAALLAKEGVMAMPPKNSAKSTTTGKLGKVNVPVKPKTVETPNVDRLKSVKPATKTSQEAKERSSVKTAKKKRDRLFGLDFLPEIDSKKGGDKVNLPFGLGSYETLPQEEDYSKNKKGGSIKRQSGGRMRKAGCKRGMGKALRGY